MEWRTFGVVGATALGILLAGCGGGGKASAAPVKWKSYSNKKHGFSLKHPTDWIPNEPSPDSVTVTPLGDITVEVVGEVTESDKSLDACVEEEHKAMRGIQTKKGWYKEQPKESATIDGQKAIRLVVQYMDPNWKGDGTKTTTAVKTYVKKGNKLFSLRTAAPTVDFDRRKSRFFDEIHSSFSLK